MDQQDTKTLGGVPAIVAGRAEWTVTLIYGDTAVHVTIPTPAKLMSLSTDQARQRALEHAKRALETAAADVETALKAEAR